MTNLISREVTDIEITYFNYFHMNITLNRILYAILYSTKKIFNIA